MTKITLTIPDHEGQQTYDLPTGLCTFHPTTASLKKYSGQRVQVIGLVLNTSEWDPESTSPLIRVLCSDGETITALVDELDPICEVCDNRRWVFSERLDTHNVEVQACGACRVVNGTHDDISAGKLAMLYYRQHIQKIPF